MVVSLRVKAVVGRIAFASSGDIGKAAFSLKEGYRRNHRRHDQDTGQDMRLQVLHNFLRGLLLGKLFHELARLRLGRIMAAEKFDAPALQAFDACVLEYRGTVFRIR
jgi:20S proteasome alpha/beta subunit